MTTEEDRIRELEISVAILKQQVAALERAQHESVATASGLAARFVSKDRFGLVEKAVYTFAAAIVLGFIGAIYKMMEWLSNVAK